LKYRRGPYSPQSAGADVRFLATVARKRSFVRVDALVQFQVDQLRERGRAYLAHERLVARVQPRMGLQVRRGAEPFLAHVALVRPFAYDPGKPRISLLNKTPNVPRKK